MLKYIMILSVIIPTFNGRHLLEKNLPFLFDALKNVKGEHEIIIVDNNSHDKTNLFIKELTDIKSHLRGDRITERPPRRCISYILLGKNRGFTGAVNEGVRNASGTYILILNNDCRLEEDTVKKMVDALEEHKEWVATQPIVYKFRIQNSEFRIKHAEIENIGYEVDLWKGKAEAVYKLKMQNSKFKIGKNIFQHRHLYGLSGTCLLMRRDIFLRIGMLDETFHSYLEDVDLFIRLAKQGYQYYPTFSATCLHDHMATSSTMGNYKEKQDVKNWVRIILKNYPLAFILRHLPALCMERLRNISGLVKKTGRMTL